jgi:hypothetical protein
VVLNSATRKFVAAGCLAALLGGASAAVAQSTVAPAIDEDSKGEFSPSGVKIGSVKLIPSFDFGAEYTDNVYAQPTDRRSDAIFTVSPRLQALYARQKLQLTGMASVDVTRFATIKRENSVSAAVEGGAVWQAQSGVQIGTQAGFNRLTEDRGTIESRNNPGSGPRITNLIFAGAQFHRERGKFLFDVAGRFDRYDATSPADDARDFTAYSLTAKSGVRIAGSTYATITAFASYRDFRLPLEGTSITRNSLTYGVRGGLELTANSFLQGHVGIGIFRFDARSGLFKDRTGLSIDASLTYKPRRRTAIIVNALRGDVATFRLGATSRTDTEFGVGIQQAAHHDLFGTLGFVWRETRYQNDTTVLRTLGAQAKVEYLINRRMAVVGSVAYTKRTSNDPFNHYERFRGGIALRLAL